mmetsp:Transcript_19569/g.28882  ORF Transcript_19569/g.28882 Transcript_19569/m.28882 type:complete len:255 (-) Transcript_19569:254-1018(-)
MLLDNQSLCLNIIKLQRTRCRITETCQNDILTSRTPENIIALLSSQSLHQINFIDNRGLLLFLSFRRGNHGLFHIVETNTDLGRTRILSMDHGKTISTRFPCQSHDEVLNIQHLHRYTRFFQPKQFQVIVQSLFGFGVTSDPDCQVCSFILPDHGTLCNIEQILLTKLFTGRKFHNVNVRRGIARLGRPTCHDICFGAELEFLNSIRNQGATIEKLECRRVVDGNDVLAHTSNVFIIETPLESGRGDLSFLLCG